MAETLVLIDGFDDYSVSADLIAGGWAGGGNTAAGNVSGLCCSPGANSNTSYTHTADAYIHDLFHWKINNAVLSTPLWRRFEGATEHLRLSYNGNGTFTFSRAGTSVGTTPTSANLGIVANTWYHIEVIARCHDTAGQYDVWINGVLACTGGGSTLDTRNGGTAGTLDRIVWNEPNTGTINVYDDVIIYTGSGGAQKGIARVITKLPTGDGANTAWTASAGADYACVDEAVPNADTDYISSATPNDIDTFTYPALGVTGTVLGVGVASLARKDDAGTRTIRDLIRQGGANYVGAVDKTLTTTYVVQQEIWEQDPASAAAWSVSGVDSAEFGVKLTA